MKHRNFIAGCVTGLLALGVISTSFALFLRTDEDKNITISGSVGTNGTFKLDKTNYNSSSVIKYDEDFVIQYNLGFNPITEYTQNIVVGKVDVKLDDSSNILQYFNINARIDGYSDTSFFAKNSTFDLNAENGYVGTITVPFSINDKYGTQSVKITLDLKEDVTPEQFLENISEKSVNYTISLSDDPTYNHAYVRGNFDDCNWQKLEKYRMVPRIDVGEFEWFYENLELLPGQELKCYKFNEEKAQPTDNDWWSSNEGSDSSADGNRVVQDSEGGKKTIYWKDYNSPLYIG